MTYEELKAAANLFGLGERASFAQIKKRHRELVKKHHPDKSGENGAEMIRRINSAHVILMDYCRSYHFAFSEAEFLEQFPEERLRRQFGWDTA